MKILLDNNVPAFVRSVFGEHEVSLAAEHGWADLTNGSLLDAAENAGFRILVTLDRGFAHQQNLSGRKISVLILVPGSQQRNAVITTAEKAVRIIDDLKPGTATTVLPD